MTHDDTHPHAAPVDAEAATTTAVSRSAYSTPILCRLEMHVTALGDTTGGDGQLNGS